MKPLGTPIYDSSMSIEAIRKSIRTAEARSMEHQKTLLDIDEKLTRKMDRYFSARNMSDKQLWRLVIAAISISGFSLGLQIWLILMVLGTKSWLG